MPFFMNRSAIQQQHNILPKSKFYEQQNFDNLTLPNFKNKKYQETDTNFFPNHTASKQFSNIDTKDFQLKTQLVHGINHPRIRQLIFSHQAPQELIKSSNFSVKKQQFKNNLTNLQLLDQRKWLAKKGKKYLINFDDEQRKQMKYCFNALDQKSIGSIGIDELQQLLLSVGLLQTRQQVKKLVDSVDQDKSGKIQFSQFITMILNDDGQNQNIVNFFKNIINQKRKQNRSTEKAQLKSKVHKKSKTISIKNIDQAKSFHINDKQNIFQNHSPQIQWAKFSNLNKKLKPSNIKDQVKNNSVLNILEKYPHPKNLPFGMVVSHIRRKHMMTALQIGENKLSKANIRDALLSSNRQNTNNALRSSQNTKQLLNSSSRGKVFHNQQDIQKGKSVMKALRKMWDRRLLRKMRESKYGNENLKALTQSGKIRQNGQKQTKSIFPGINN